MYIYIHIHIHIFLYFLYPFISEHLVSTSWLFLDMPTLNTRGQYLFNGFMGHDFKGGGVEEDVPPLLLLLVLEDLLWRHGLAVACLRDGGIGSSSLGGAPGGTFLEVLPLL